MISADYYKSLSDLIVTNYQDLLNWEYLEEIGRFAYIKSSHAEVIFTKLLSSKSLKFGKSTFLLHGDDATISLATAHGINSLGYKIKSVNWLGDHTLVEPLPIGIPTADRLPNISREDFDSFTSIFSELRMQSSERDIYLYANFDITTNMPLRKRALLAALPLKDSYCPTSRIGLSMNLHNLSKSKYVLSPPGAGPDCFRTWEAIYMGAVPIVLRSQWPFNHLDLPVLVVDAFDDLGQQIADFENEGRFRNVSWEDHFRLS